MSKLPEPNWISLQETLDLVVDRTGATAKAVEWALVDAFTDNRIVTLGCCPTYIRARTGDTPTRLNGIAWRGADVSWKTGKFRIPRRAGYGQGYGPLFHTFEKVAVRREDVIRWLSPDDGGPAKGTLNEAPAGEEEVPAAGEAKPGAKGDRRRNVGDDALLKNRIESVLAHARRKWPDSKSRQTPYAMAKEMREGEVNGKIEDFAENTVKKILGGTYPTMARLNITPL